MKRIMLSFVIVVGLLVGDLAFTHAQDCDPLLPCGPIPWALPSFPDLRSPTPFPTVVVVATGGTITPSATPTVTTTPTPLPTATTMPTWTPFPTLTPYPTWTPFMDSVTIPELDDALEYINTLEAMLAATAIPINDINGTPVSMDTVTDLSENIPTVFDYAYGLSEVNFGVLTPLVVFMFVALVVFLFINMFKFFFLPIVVLIGLMRRIGDLIMQFIQAVGELIPL